MNIAYHWKRKATPILCIATGIVLDRVRDVLDGGAEALRGRVDLLEAPRRTESAPSCAAIAISIVTRMHDRADHEADVHPVGHPVAGGLL